MQAMSIKFRNDCAHSIVRCTRKPFTADKGCAAVHGGDFTEQFLPLSAIYRPTSNTVTCPNGAFRCINPVSLVADALHAGRAHRLAIRLKRLLKCS